MLTSDVALGTEERCDELGAACVCSEPLNVFQELGSSYSFEDPADSNTKECPGEGNDGAAVYFEEGGDTPAEDGMPAGNRVDYYWRQAGDGVNHITGRPYPDQGMRLLCSRYYQRFSQDFLPTTAPEITGPCERVKLSEFNTPDAWIEIGVHASRFTGGFVLGNRDFSMPFTGTQMGMESCRDQWCRFELCVSGPMGQASTGGVTGRGRITGVSTGEVMEFHYDGPPAEGVDTRFRRIWIANLYNQGECVGSRHLSHAMQAEWPVDAGQWIGPAYEIEGGNGSGPPPDPDPDPQPDPDPDPDPQPDPDPPPASSAPGAPLLLDAGDQAASSGSLRVVYSHANGQISLQSVLTSGTGPYQFLFDCTHDGGWNGVYNTPVPTAAHQCPATGAGSQDVKAWSWDQGTNEVNEIVIPISLD